MDKEFTPYEQALDLKELGFDEPCFATYRTHAVGSKKPFEYDLDYHTKVEMSSNVIPINSEYTEESKWISAPTYSQAFRWFREKYDIICHPERWGQNLEYACKFDLYDKKERKLGHIRNEDNTLVSFKTYKEAELECLKKLIQIVKEQR